MSWGVFKKTLLPQMQNNAYGTISDFRTTRIGRETGGQSSGADSNRGWQGDYAMAGMYTRTLNYGEVEKIYNSLKSRYGI